MRSYESMINNEKYLKICLTHVIISYTIYIAIDLGRKNMSNTHIIKQEDVRLLLEYLKDNPHEVERFNQCFNCLKLGTCEKNCKEDKHGMCKECIPISS